jgi:N-acetylglutamate synthase-like GNAT family acetyltransferase
MPPTFAAITRDGYVLSNDPSTLSIDTIFAWLTNEAYWSLGRSRETIDTAISNSHLYGVVSPEGATIACTRVVTDEATFAWIADVFVASELRGRGIGTWMVGEVAEFWLEVGVKRILLATKDAHEVYKKVGFAPLASPERFMEIDRRHDF